MNKLVYKFVVELKSPLSIGSSSSSDSDHDVILYGDGTPFVPATSISGSFFSKYEFENKVNIFGTQQNISDNNGIMTESALFVSDGIFVNAKNIIPLIRDFNKIPDDFDEKIKFKEKGNGKFDTLYIKENNIFKFFIVYSIKDNEIDKKLIKDSISNIVSKINNGIYRLGYKQNRGFGQIEIKEVYFYEFSKELNNYKDYLDFDGYLINQKENNIINELIKNNDDINDFDYLIKEAKLDGSLIIRKYKAFDDNDYEQMTLDKDTAIIPATSILGVLQSRVRKIAKEFHISINLEELTKVVIDEAYLKGGEIVNITRTRIDRLSSNVMAGALFTEGVWYAKDGSDNKCVFKIRFKTKDETIRKLYKLALDDLLLGYAPIGGETSIGRGIFKEIK